MNLQITELRLKAQPSTSLKLKEQWVTTIIEVIMAVDSVVADYTQLFEQSFKVLKILQEDPSVHRLETEVHELQQCYDEVKGTM